MPGVLAAAGTPTHDCVNAQLYLSGVLDHCVHILSLDPRSLRRHWDAVATLAQLTRSVSLTV